MASLVATVPNAPILARCFLVRYLSPARGAHARMRKHLRVPYAAGRPDSARRRKPRYSRRAGRAAARGPTPVPHPHASTALLRACHGCQGARGPGGLPDACQPAAPLLRQSCERARRAPGASVAICLGSASTSCRAAASLSLWSSPSPAGERRPSSPSRPLRPELLRRCWSHAGCQHGYVMQTCRKQACWLQGC